MEGDSFLSQSGGPVTLLDQGFLLVRRVMLAVFHCPASHLLSNQDKPEVSVRYSFHLTLPSISDKTAGIAAFVRFVAIVYNFCVFSERLEAVVKTQRVLYLPPLYP